MYGGYCLGMRFECDVLMYGKYEHVTCFYGDTPPKFNIAPEKWWLEDEFPFEIAYFFRGYVKFPVYVI